MTDTLVGQFVLRRALREEIDYLVSMAERAHAESLFSHMTFDPEKPRRIIAAAVRGHPTLFLAVIVRIDTEVPVGGMLASIQESYFGPDTIAIEMLTLLEPEYRGRCGRELKLLLDWYKTWAISEGAKRIYLSTTTGVLSKSAAHMYEHCGFAQIGTIHEAGR